MFGFSFAEMIVVLIVAALLLKPEDLPIIAKKIKELKAYFAEVKHEINKNFSDLTSDTDIAKEVQEDIEEINFYLKRIVELGGAYTGDYNLTQIKAHYRSMNKERVTKQITARRDETHSKPNEPKI
ncbi:MAG: hypothetical protein K0R02_89 [Rickettsiaceae bacterium]|jgi:Sec-independent protein translocase protein TatA|nr:hypothetical protein [Rickettsiaceae bacterium]